MVPSQQKPFAERFPQAVYWLDLGLLPKPAKALVQAGYLALADLAGKSREEMLAIPGIGKGSVRKLEKHLGCPFPMLTIAGVGQAALELREQSPVLELLEHGLSLQVANALVRAGFDSFEKVSRLTREQYLAQSGLGDRGMRQLEAVLGRRLDSPVGELCAQGLTRATAYRLSSAGVRRLAELASRPDSDLRSLGLTPGDLEECRRLLRKAEEGSR
jgi:hypothetical protein